MKKKTMTINLTEHEFEIVEKLCKKKGISKIALVRQSIRLYQQMEKRIEDGKILWAENDKFRKEIIIV